jgi:hypothetical protein
MRLPKTGISSKLAAVAATGHAAMSVSRGRPIAGGG